MTVIVGIEAGEEHEAVVLASDRCYVNNLEIIDNIYNFSSQLEQEKLSNVFSKLGKGIPYNLGRKLKFSKDKKTALTFTGTKQDETRLISQYFLSPEKFLRRKDIIRTLISPIVRDGPNVDALLKDYHKNFPIMDGSVDLSVQMVNFLRAVRDKRVTKDALTRFLENPIMGVTEDLYDDYSLFLLSKLEMIEGNPWARLYKITRIGQLKDGSLYTNGSGGDIAMEYIQNNFPHRVFFNEVSLSRTPTIEEAVTLATGAVRKACEENVFCKGLDYLILTKDGIETHFDNTKEEGYIHYQEIFESRLKNSENRLNNYKKILKALPK